MIELIYPLATYCLIVSSSMYFEEVEWLYKKLTRDGYEAAYMLIEDNNNDGYTVVKSGRTAVQVMHIARRLGLKTIDTVETDYDKFIKKMHNYKNKEQKIWSEE